jgi:gamma-glutamyltranspeptidase/glutathione hydrolase
MKRLLGVVCLMLAFALAGCGSVRTDRSPIGGVVAADHRLASEAGAEILRAGGNAVDAAVATSFALSVVRPYSCGIGGGGFMVIHLPDDPTRGAVTTALNYRETTPAGIDPASYERWRAAGDARASRDGGRAVGVPGTVAGLLAALERYGTLDRRTVLAPAIRYAEQGFVVDADHAAVSAGVARRLSRDAALAARFAWMGERARLREGDVWRVPAQAEVLRAIAERGSAGFYGGEVASAIVGAVRGDGGVLTLEDLAGYRVREVAPLRVGYGSDELLLMPPPSSGGIALAQAFGVLGRLGTEIPGEGWYAGASGHELVEAFKHAFADRARHLGDADFVDVPVDELLDSAYLDELASRVGARTLESAAYGTDERLMGAIEDGGTSHVSVVDRWGGAVSCTETINTGFGSLLAVERFGFVLNNEMDDFTTVRGAVNAYGLTQSDANLPEAGKRPLSSMSPTIVVDADGNVRAVAGASGGPRIISGTGQVLLRMLSGGAGAPEAVRAPRVHHQWLPDVVRLEGDGDAALRAGLLERGHLIGEIETVGVVQAIVRVDGGWSAASDPRKGGEVVWE